MEIVSTKTPAVYAEIFRRRAIPLDAAMMVGNSLKSDVLPVLALGGWGVHVPHELTWALEHDTAPEDAARFRLIDDLGQLPALLDRIETAG